MEKLRLSSYTIPVRLEGNEGKYMLVHGYTGAIDMEPDEGVSFKFLFFIGCNSVFLEKRISNFKK